MRNNILKIRNKLSVVSAWVGVIRIIATNLFLIIMCPSFVMFSCVALGLGSMGIWIVFFPDQYDTCKKFAEQVDNVSVFTFCIATLGGMAAEYFFEGKGGEDDVVVDLEKVQSKHLAFFLWATAAVLSFYALGNDDGIVPGLGSTLVLWLCVNIHRPKFRAISAAAVGNLSPDLSTGSAPSSQVQGKGL